MRFLMAWLLCAVAPAVLAQEAFDRHQVHNEDLDIVSFSAVDFDDDEDADIVALNRIGDGVQVLWFENIGQGTFLRGRELWSTLSPSFDLLLTADLNNNGAEDLILGRKDWFNTGGLFWVENEGGSFEALREIDAENAGPVKVLDLNADGFLDIVRGGISVTAYLNQGDVPSTEPRFQYHGTLAPGPARAFALEDIDGDDDPDLVSTHLSFDRWNDYLLYYENRNERPYFLNFGSERLGIGDFNRFVTSVILTDIDNNGRLDAIAAYFDNSDVGEGGRLVWIENVGTADIPHPFTISTGPTNRPNEPWTTDALIALDLDGDGDQDIVNLWVQNRSDVITWYENPSELGNGVEQQLWPEHLIGSPEDSRGLVAADFDGDGFVDFLTTDFGSLVWFENPGIVNSPIARSPETVSDLVFLNVWPNPASSLLSVAFAAPSHTISIEVFDVLGRLLKVEDVEVHDLREGKIQLSVDMLSPGTYFMRLTDEHGSSQSRTFSIVR